MKNVQRYMRCDNYQLIGSAMTDSDGFMRDSPIVARSGVYIYLNADGTMRREYRPPEEVFNIDSLATFKGKPITVEHPKAGKVTSETAQKLSIGSILSEGYSKSLVVDSDDKLDKYVACDIVLFNPKAIGEKRELSLGYRCDCEETKGETPSGEQYDAIQRNIRVNHLAVVEKARAGMKARLNCDGDEFISLDDDSETMNQENTDTTEEIKQTSTDKAVEETATEEKPDKDTVENTEPVKDTDKAEETSKVADTEQVEEKPKVEETVVEETVVAEEKPKDETPVQKAEQENAETDDETVANTEAEEKTTEIPADNGKEESQAKEQESTSEDDAEEDKSKVAETVTGEVVKNNQAKLDICVKADNSVSQGNLAQEQFLQEGHHMSKLRIDGMEYELQDSVINHINSLQSRLDCAEKEKVATQAVLDATEERLAKTEEKVADKDKELAEKDAKIAEVEAEKDKAVADAEEEKAEAVEQAKKENAEALEEKEDELEDEKKEKVALEDKLDSAENNIVAMKTILEKAQADLKMRQDANDELQAKLDELNKQIEEATKERDSLQAKVDAAEDDKEKAVEQAKEETKAEMAERSELEDVAKQAKIDDVDDMSNEDLKLAIIKAVRGEDFDAEGKSEGYLDGAFDAAKESLRSDSVRVQMKKVVGSKPAVKNDSASSSAEARRQAMMSRLQDAYKSADMKF